MSYHSTEQLNKRNINDLFICPETIDYTVRGYDYGDYNSFIKVTIRKCAGVGCKSQQTINTILTDKMLNVVFVNTYFDFEDYVAPVKTFLDERASYRIANGSRKYIEIYAQKRTAKYSDSYYDVFEQAKTEQFIGVETISQDFDTETGAGAVLFQVFIKLDPNQQAYGREVYSFFDLTGDVGGVFELM